MENIYRLARLIYYHISRKISVEDQGEVEQWLEESERHKRLFETFKSREFMELQLSEHGLFDEEKGYSRFVAAKRSFDKRRSLLYITGIVAGLVLLFGVGMAGWLFSTEMQGKFLTKVEESPVLPGERKAVLVLNDGERINLKDRMQVKVAENGTRILLEGGDENFVVTQDVPDSSLHMVYTPIGGEYSLILADGTRVWLNASSRLYFPAVFQKDRREVLVEGEVYFEVSKDVARPFLVRTGDIVIKVLGTSFNVRAYSDEKYKATLIKGSVAVRYGEETINIKPGQQWVLEEEGPRVYDVKVKGVIGWKNGDFAFEDQALTDVFRDLERWYDVRISISDEEVRNMKFTGIFPRYENIEEVLNIIELATCVKCNMADKTIVVSMDK